jgi:hypothetical protein
VAPVVLDVFLLQALVNILLGHFAGLALHLLALGAVAEGRGVKFQRQQHIQRLREAELEQQQRVGNGGGNGAGSGGSEIFNALLRMGGDGSGGGWRIG